MVSRLIELLGKDKVSTSASDLEAHGRDEGYPQTAKPVAVVYAESPEDVSKVLELAAETDHAVIPFGAGTSLEGSLLPLKPTISLDLTRMNRILEVHPEDFLAVVEAGVTRKQLNERLRREGLFFPVDPGADATLGGMAATNASGTTTVRYGGMHANVLALEAVMANGELVRFGRPVRKTSSGYDIKDLLIGSEGTLGVITKLWVKLHPLPAEVHTVRVYFESIADAAQGAYALMAAGLPVARLELVDEQAVAAVNRHLGRDYPEKPLLLVEFHSSTPEAVQAESAFAEELLRDAGAVGMDTAKTAEERTAQWEARHEAYWALVHMYPGREYLLTDTAVPLSKMPGLVKYAQDLMQEMQLTGNILGHVGDGNFHTIIAATAEEYPKAEEFSKRLVSRALELGGTATGEHGIGLRKMKFMEAEHGPALAWMKRIKQTFDPQGILNPGKILPE
ncbi:FAD-binding oxidoreductase [Oceanithermus sp.]